MMSVDPVFSRILALSCALLLALAASQKLRRWRDFVAIVENYRIVPAPAASAVATLVLLWEMSAAPLLVLPITRAVGAVAASLLFIAYGLAIALNLIRGRTHIDCGCVGAAKRGSIGKWMVWRNGVLATTTAITALPIASRTLSLLDVLTTCSSLAALALLYAAFDQLGVVTSRARTP